MTPVAGEAAAIAVEGLTRRFGALTAVRSLSLAVTRGEIFGFLGLNGTGKTTTIRVLLGLLHPTAGRAWMLGHDCQRDGLAARAQVGYLPGESARQDLRWPTSCMRGGTCSGQEPARCQAWRARRQPCRARCCHAPRL